MNNVINALVAHLVWLNMPYDERPNIAVTTDIHTWGYVFSVEQFSTFHNVITTVKATVVFTVRKCISADSDMHTCGWWMLDTDRKKTKITNNFPPERFVLWNFVIMRFSVPLTKGCNHRHVWPHVKGFEVLTSRKPRSVIWAWWSA
jgi:hypothetical protein